MAKGKAKPRRKEIELPAEPQHQTLLIVNPPRPSVPLLATSAALLAAWLSYLLVVAIWG